MANLETGTGASRVMFLNSADATQHQAGSSITTDYIFIPDESIVVPPHHSILMSLHHTQIPFSFYNFQSGRNTNLDYGLTDTGVVSNSTTGTITIPEGNYNAATLLNKIMELLNAETNVGTLTIRFNRDTLKYEFNWVGLNNYRRLTLRIATGTNTATNFRDEMGFNSNKFYLGSDVFNVYFENDGGGSGGRLECGYSSDAADTPYFIQATGADTTFWTGAGNQGGLTENIFSVVDMNAAIRSLYVRTNLSTTSVLDSSVGGGFSSILARVPIDVDSGGIITISPSDGSVHKLIIKVREITIIGVRLTDQRNRVIDLNGLDWDISLQFDFIEKPELKIPMDKRMEIDLKKYEKFKTDKEALKKKK
tara:strand:- start:2815 stop:3909 length:1095 start_codon:yes stop_codon:yes gene_type:complete